MIIEKRNRKVIAIASILMITLSFAAFLIGEKAEQAITGKVTSRVFIMELPPSNCSLNLRQGWNMASFHCELGIKTINKTLVDQNNNTLNYYAIFEYQSNNQTDKWKSYNPFLPNWTVQQISTITRFPGYWIYMNSSGTYTRVGYQFESTSISLNEGWNLIGYPSENEINITNGFQTINGYFDRVESYQYNNSIGEWLIYIPGENETLTKLEPMKAYWINVTNSTSWVVTW